MTGGEFSGGLLERDAELTRVQELLHQARAGSGALTVIRGPAGIGKTSIAGRVAAEAADAGFTVLRARAGELESDFAFGVARNMFEPAIRAAKQSIFDGAAAFARPALDPGAPAPEPSTALGSDPAASIIHGLYWLLVNLADRAPVLAVIDDAQWADAASLRFLHYLARRVEDLPVLLLVTVRAGSAMASGLPDAVTMDPGAVVIEPPPLSAGAVRSMIAHRLGAEPSEEFLDACMAATGGNPFLVVELLAALAAERIGPSAASAEAVPRVRPRAIQHGVLLRLARLPEKTRELAIATAVLGDGASLHTASTLAGLPAADGARAADALAEAGMLAPRLPLEFVHPLVRSGVYESMPPAQRAISHRRAAEILGAEGASEDAIAAQFMLADPRGDSAAVSTLRAAARGAVARGAPDVAIGYLRRALTEPPQSDEERAEVRAELGRAEALAHDPRAAEDLELAHQALRSARDRALIATDLGRALMMSGRLDDAIERFERAIDELGEPGSELSLRLEAELIGAARLDIRHRSTAADRLSRVAMDLTAHGAAERLVLANVAFEQVVRGEPAQHTAELAAASLGGGALLAEESSDAPIFYLAVWALALSGHLADAYAQIEAALEDARRRGSALAFTIASCFGSNVLFRMGRIADAHASARSVLDVSPEQRWALGLPLALGFLLDAMLERGELDAAQTTLEQTGMPEDIPDFTLFIPLLFSRGRLRIARGQRDAGLADLLRCGDRAKAWGSRNPVFLPWREHAARLLNDAGERERARELATEDLALARAAGSEVATGIALRSTAMLEHGDRSVELLRESVACLSGTEARLEHARSTVELGAALRRSGRRADSREPLAHGRELANQCGATVLERRAYEELLAAGSRPRRLMLSGVESLTPSEQRVANLAAAGQSNTEIAQALFITRKTVEKHLGNVYLKLGISSREQLPELLGDRNLTPLSSFSTLPASIRQGAQT